MSAAQAQPVTLTGAWARATAPMQDTGVVYFSIAATTGDTLLSVSSPDAAGAMLHQTTSQGGMSGMADMDQLAVPAGGTVRLAPNGSHIMLMNLKHPLVAGRQVSVDLVFAKAGRMHLQVPVQPIGATGAPPPTMPN